MERARTVVHQPSRTVRLRSPEGHVSSRRPLRPAASCRDRHTTRRSRTARLVGAVRPERPGEAGVGDRPAERSRDDRRAWPGRSVTEIAKALHDDVRRDPSGESRCGARRHDPSAARPARSAGQPRLWRDQALGPTRRHLPAQTRPRLAGGAVVGARRGRPRRSGRPTSRGSAPARAVAALVTIKVSGQPPASRRDGAACRPDDR